MLIGELFSSIKTTSKPQTQHPQEKEQRCTWQALSEYVCKINVNAAYSIDLSICCLRVVIHDHRGLVLATKSFPQANPPVIQEGEALAILEGLLFAKDLGFTKVVAESDCRSVIQLV